jgi:histidinol-phosphate aminotransferase
MNQDKDMNPRIRASVRAMSGYVPGEQPKLPNIVKLNTNENPYPPSPAVADAVAALDTDLLRLYPDPECAALVDAIAALHQCRTDQILVANGSDEALRLCADAFVENDGDIGYFDPSYSLYPVLTAMRGARSNPVDIWPDLTWRMPSGYSAELFYLTNPNAPTGMLFDKAQVRAFCETFPGVVLIDEAYVDFAREHCMDLALTLPNVLVCRTLSKSYSLAGLRFGYLVGDAELIAALQKLRDSYNIDRIAQAAALAAIQDQPWMHANVARIQTTRQRLTDELRAMGWQVHDSETNFLWAIPAKRSAREVFDALRSRAIIVRYWPGENIGRYIRITIGTDTQIDTLLAVLKEES